MCSCSQKHHSLNISKASVVVSGLGKWNVSSTQFNIYRLGWSSNCRLKNRYIQIPYLLDLSISMWALPELHCQVTSWISSPAPEVQHIFQYATVRHTDHGKTGIEPISLSYFTGDGLPWDVNIHFWKTLEKWMSRVNAVLCSSSGLVQI